MRFISGGPVIPDSLLSERDAGRVVFLCGAGVSVPSGMPNFEGLTQYVIDRLGCPSDSETRKAFDPWINPKPELSATARIPLDQIFNLLQNEYGRDQVGKLVTERLAVTDPAKVRSIEHGIISRISASRDGSPQIVTSNFDHLFEYAAKPSSMRIHKPPTFPDLQHGVSLSGVTYLHGRLSETGAVTHDYVLSSSDFGRAYLAQGWATNFIRQLLLRYTVILLGYQAEDPPVKYLLQGLNFSPDSHKQRLYALDQGSPDEIEAKWLDRGVIPIAYPSSSSHQPLWDTLEAWARRSDSPKAWRSSIVDLAGKGPEALKPHERGMVAHLARTTAGAKLFAEAAPVLPIEWLCVLDSTCRLARPFSGASEKFDPLEVYGLDDDPPRSVAGEQEDSQTHEDLITWRSGDDSSDHTQRLAGRREYMSSRLFHLSQWMLRSLEKPALAWWVARQYRLHPNLREWLKRAVEDSNALEENTRKLWMILVETLEGHDDDSQSMEWFQMLRRVKASGWTSSVIRAFEAATEPSFKISTPYGASSVRPPIGDWSTVKWDEIANIDISFPSRHGETITVPDRVLGSVFSALQRNLIRSSGMINEANKAWFKLATLYPKIGNDGLQHIEGADSYVSWFIELFDRMAIVEPLLLRAHIKTWPDPEGYLFDKLRLYVWNKVELFSGSESAEQILALHDDQFWCSENERELLFLLKNRWSSFSPDNKRRLVDRILSGRPKYDGENNDEYVRYRSIGSVAGFSWLVKEGCDMPAASQEKCMELKAGIPDWRESWVDQAADSVDGRSGWVKTNDDASVLDGVPVSQIIQVARQNTRSPFMEFVDYKPFRGLVKKFPAKAISALGVAARQGDNPADFWNELISNWPDTASARASRLLQERMRRLPKETLFEIRWAVGDWLKDKFPKLAQTDETYALSVFDDLIRKLLSYGPEATKSAIGQTMVGGEVVQRSRRTVEYAINSPIGKAADGLLTLLDSKNIQQGNGLPAEITVRIEQLLDSPGEGSDHVIGLLSKEIGWLNYLDPDWVSSKMIPWFNIDHVSSEPAWSGVLTNDCMRIQSIFGQIKSTFVVLQSAIQAWSWRDDAERRIYEWIVQASLLIAPDSAPLTFDEARDCLRRIDQDGLSHVIWFLGRVGGKNDQGWKKMVVPFIQFAWPRELRFQTTKTSKAWLLMLDDTDEAFPAVLNVAREFLRPIGLPHVGLYGFYGKGDRKDVLAKKFPTEMVDLLDLVISDDPRCLPYDLGKVLDLLLESMPSIEADRRYERLRELEASR